MDLIADFVEKLERYSDEEQQPNELEKMLDDFKVALKDKQIIIAGKNEVVVRLKRDVVKVAWCSRDCETCSDPKYNNAGDCKCCQAWDAIENQLKAALEEK